VRHAGVLGADLLGDVAQQLRVAVGRRRRVQAEGRERVGERDGRDHHPRTRPQPGQQRGEQRVEVASDGAGRAQRDGLGRPEGDHDDVPVLERPVREDEVVERGPDRGEAVDRLRERGHVRPAAGAAGEAT
jgi:hypothetical protein